MNDRELIRKAVTERILNRKDIRERAIALAEARLRTDPIHSSSDAISEKPRTAAQAEGIDHNIEPAGKPLKFRKMLLAANVLLLVLVIGLIGETTKKYWLPADGTTVQTTESTTAGVYELKEIPASVDAIFFEFLASHNIQMAVNGGMGSCYLHFPDSFEAIEDGYPIGEFLRQRNVRSILNGLDFSSYLGKDITLIGSSLKSAAGESKIGRASWRERV